MYQKIVYKGYCTNNHCLDSFNSISVPGLMEPLTFLIDSTDSNLPPGMITLFGIQCVSSCSRCRKSRYLVNVDLSDCPPWMVLCDE